MLTGKTHAKLGRRLNHLKEVLEDSLKEPVDVVALIALYHTVRDIQPGLCEAVAQLSENREWELAYFDPMFSDKEQQEMGEFLWPEEVEKGTKVNHG